MYQPESRKTHQISFMDFNQAYGINLDKTNEWVKLAERIPWSEMEGAYKDMFPSKTGRPAVPFRMALGVLIIQKRKGLSDRAVIKEISENPYLQYFIGLDSFTTKAPLRPTVLVSLRRRLNVDYLIQANDIILSKCDKTKEHKEDNESEAAQKANAKTDDIDNLGTTIIDATCSPSNIKYPQDFVLLNDARECLEEMIDFFHKTFNPWQKPRTYRKIARADYLSMAKTKKKSTKKLRSLIRRQLGCIKRDIKYLEDYMQVGYALNKKYINKYLTILKLYEQQKYMYDNKTHSVKDRIVSISQPYIRPIVRGKAKTPVEFGAKYDVSIDEKGHARLEKISFDPYNESTIFINVMERYRKRTGHYPKRVLVDQIYRTRENRRFCKDHGISMSGPRLGRPAKTKNTKEEYQNNVDRIEVERFFSKEKRCNGAGLIMTKLHETTLGAIALSVLVTNLFSTEILNFFVFFFGLAFEDYNDNQFIVIDDMVA